MDLISSGGTLPPPRPPVWRCRYVFTAPGMSALAVIPSSAQRRVASTANSTLAVLDWP
jgi:hypothetical protein